MCDDCGSLRKLAGVPSCVTVRICRTFDENLRRLLPNQGYTQYLVADQSIRDDHDTTGRWISRECDAINDDTPEEFVVLVQRIHRRIFERVLPSVGGIIRTSAVSVDHGDHCFDGVAPELIVERLHALWKKNGGVGLAPADHEKLSWWAARFFQEFFRIHPFRDGNGRTARLYVELAARRHGFLVNWATSREAVRAYSRALRYAHKQLGVTPAPALREPDRDYAAFVPLARWVQGCVLQDRAPDVLVEEPAE